MALMNRPSEDMVIEYAEEGDVEKENRELSPVVDYVTTQYHRARDKRQNDEARWLDAYRNYRGIYGPDTQFTETEKSQVFVKITKTKVLAAYAQICDVLFAGSKFPIGIEASKIPNNVEDIVSVDPKAPEGLEDSTALKSSSVSRGSILDAIGPLVKKLKPFEDKLKAGDPNSPTALVFEPAVEAARRMEKRIHDQLDEAHADKHLRSTAFEMALFGTGCIKGPFAMDKEYPKWDESGKYSPLFETVPSISNVSIWNIYPDPDARNMGEAEKFIERHRMSRTQLRSLKKRPHFRNESIELAIADGTHFQAEYWESTLEDGNVTDIADRFEVLEYWGIIDKDIAETAELKIPKELEDNDEIQVNIWVCNNQILRLVMNPFTPTNIPYYVVPYELNPYSFFGIGVAENMEDTQLLMNGFMRMSVDNAALSGNVLLEIDETNMVPGQTLDLFPGKTFRRQGGSPGQAIFGTKIPNISQELFMMFDKARQLADESTGIPSYSHGQSGVQSVGRTASGMSMLLGAAAQNIKSVIRGIDDYLLSPLGKALFAFNMQFNFDKDITGDLDVVARGTESLMRNEVRSQRLLQFMQISANPIMQPFVKYDYILRELAASMDLDEDKILNDPREAALQATLMAQMQAIMGPPPGAPGQQQGGPNGAPPVSDPTGTGNGNIAPGAAPQPGAAGFTGAGGGANGGNPPPQGVPV